MYLLIDRGNTRVKLGWTLTGDGPLDVWHGPVEDMSARVREWLSGAPDDSQPLMVGWLSVAQQDWQPDTLPIWESRRGPTQWNKIDHQWPFPVENRYRTQRTLGTDRLVGVVAAHVQCPGKPVLVIDVGTAITYDVANAQGAYLGGGIAAGLSMRFDALHHFTARLPRVDLSEDIPLIGDSTEHSIQAGVWHGVMAEVEGMVYRYRQALGPDLHVFLTGGDAARFEKQLSCFTFADQHLILKGILYLLTHPSHV